MTSLLVCMTSSLPMFSQTFGKVLLGVGPIYIWLLATSWLTLNSKHSEFRGQDLGLEFWLERSFTWWVVNAWSVKLKWELWSIHSHSDRANIGHYWLQTQLFWGVNYLEIQTSHLLFSKTNITCSFLLPVNSWRILLSRSLRRSHMYHQLHPN